MRSIPDVPWYLRKWAIVLIYGALIFGTIAFEFEYLLQSVWRSYMVYGAFVIILSALVMMGVTIASLSIVVTYKSLCCQNYNWWWNSFILGASGGVYMFAYTAYIFISNQEKFKFAPDFMAFLSMTLISTCFGLMCGSISVLASYTFVERIY